MEVEKEFEIPLPAKGECDVSFDRKTRIPRATRTLIPDMRKIGGIFKSPSTELDQDWDSGLEPTETFCLRVSFSESFESRFNPSVPF